MNVVHILWSGRIGGKERALYQLVRSQLQYSAFRPAVAFGQGQGHYFDLFQELGCPVIDLGMRNGRDFLRLPFIKRMLQGFALHHFHGAEPTIMLGSLACKGPRRIYTHRGGVQAPGLGRKLFYCLVGMFLKQGFSGLSANTRHAALAASQITHIPVRRWRITHNGLDFTSLGSRGSIDDVAARNGLQPDKKTIIGTTANLRELKRIELLLEACAGLEPESYQVLIVGDGPDRQRLMTISRDLGIHNRTIFTGMQKNVADYLAAMDIFVLPSGPRESFGNSIVEAMAVGLPAVVFADGGGLVEHVDDGKTGFIVNSVGELSDRLRCLMKEPSLRAELGQNAAAHVRNKYTLENMVRQYDRVYELALSPGKTA